MYVLMPFQYSGARYIVMQRGGTVLGRAVLLKRNSSIAKIIRYGTITSSTRLSLICQDLEC